MVDKIFATIWMLALAGFMLVVTGFVNEPDLWIIVIFVLILGAFDFVREIRQMQDSSGNASQPQTAGTAQTAPPEARSEAGPANGPVDHRPGGG